MKVNEIMTTDVRTVSSSDSIQQAASIMEQINVGSVPVVDNNKVVGIVTDRDIVVRGLAKGQDTNQKVSSVMSSNVAVATPDMDVHKAANIMAEKQIRRLPVVDNNNGSLVGMLAIGDLAVESIFENEAGEALHDISQGVRH